MVSPASRDSAEMTIFFEWPDSWYLCTPAGLHSMSHSRTYKLTQFIKRWPVQSQGRSKVARRKPQRSTRKWMTITLLWSTWSPRAVGLAGTACCLQDLSCVVWDAGHSNNHVGEPEVHIRSDHSNGVWLGDLHHSDSSSFSEFVWGLWRTSKMLSANITGNIFRNTGCQWNELTTVLEIIRTTQWIRFCQSMCDIVTTYLRRVLSLKHWNVAPLCTFLLELVSSTAGCPYMTSRTSAGAMTCRQMKSWKLWPSCRRRLVDFACGVSSLQPFCYHHVPGWGEIVW